MKKFGSNVFNFLVVSAITVMLSPVSMSFAAVVNDEVTSVKLKEADGTSGQNTNSGSGVKTGHIQDGAVVTSKILDGAVTDAKISGPIAGSKLGAHGHNSSDIVGTISTSNLPVGTAVGTVAAGEHTHDSVYQKKYANVIVVAKSGGDFTDPVAAVNSVTGSSVTNPYLVKIMPGVYDIGNQSINFKQGVVIEGSGKKATLITGNNAGNTGWSALINGASDSSLKNLSIEINGVSQPAIGVMYMGYVKNFSIENVNINAISQSGAGAWGINASGPGNDNFILSDLNIKVSSNTNTVYGIQTWGINTKISRCNIDVTGSELVVGVMLISSIPQEFIVYNTDITINGGTETYGLRNWYGNLVADTIKIKSQNNGYDNYSIDSQGNTKIINSLIQGRNMYLDSAKLINNYDENYNAIVNQ